MPAPRACLSPAPNGGLYWGELTEGRLVRRYKRFLADVRLPGGETITAHTPNTGAMLGCSTPGSRVWLSLHDKPSRKYKYTLEIIETPGGLVGVDTGVPNRLVAAAIAAGRIAEIPLPATVRREITRGDSRLDLLVECPQKPDTLVEIKNCTLVEDGTALFPDAVTARGAKHLDELARLAGDGFRAVIFILVQRGDALRFAPADHIDPFWGARLRQALAAGVELLAYRADLDLHTIRVEKRLPVRLDGKDTETRIPRETTC